MKRLTVTVGADFYLFSELAPGDKDLLAAAAEVCENAQAPYSDFFVGAAVRSAASGRIYRGCNVERVTWTQTTHAEGNAIDSMVAAEGPVKVGAIAIVAAPRGTAITLPPSGSDIFEPKLTDASVPCGHCLQCIWENCYDDPDVRLLGLTENGHVSVVTIGDAVPPYARFGPSDLGITYEK